MSFLWSFGAKKEQSPPPVLQKQPAPAKAMSHSFKKGVHYNMKVILRGDVMTGKSSLFERLQGHEFAEEYNTTPEIQVMNIPWTYNDSQDIIKVEIWDVIDKANQTKSEGIKLEHHVPQPTTIGLDATTVHVYRNTHAAIFLFDLTKPWTFDYVNNELEHVPGSISVLVLGNFADKKDRKVELEQIHSTLYKHNQERIKKDSLQSNLIRYAETSMKSGLGLKYIYDYLGVPFLQLMMETLRKQLELKQVEIVDLLENLDGNEDVPEAMQRRRGQDNFNQPSEPRLEHVELRDAWYKELDEIAADYAVQPNIPPPPTSPVKATGDIQMPQESTIQFDTGEELADDWFGEPSEVQSTIVIQSEPDEPINPMVAGDEDVQADYYDKVETKPEHYQSLYKQDAWNHPNDLSISESEEEQTSPFTFSGGYEEISEGTDNPWSKEDHWASSQPDTMNIKKASKKKQKKKRSSQVRK